MKVWNLRKSFVAGGDHPRSASFLLEYKNSTSGFTAHPMEIIPEIPLPHTSEEASTSFFESLNVESIQEEIMATMKRICWLMMMPWLLLLLRPRFQED